MNYASLNDNNKRRIKSICCSDAEMRWEDPDLVDKLIGELPKIRSTKYDDKVPKELAALKDYYYSYDYIESNNSSFIAKVKELINDIRTKVNSWYGLDIYQIESCINIQKSCVLRGDGGAGKTFFVMKLEEKLSETEIPHLCIYGKFEEDLKHIDFEEIESVSRYERFVFVVDAINEMRLEAQNELCSKLKSLMCNKGLQIIITYRNGTIDENTQELLNSISLYDYNFLGVSYESAIENMVRLGVPDVYKYEDILFTNNAMLLSNLMTVLSSHDITSDDKNNIGSVTHLIENGGIKSRVGRNEWEKTKVIASWMLEHESHSVPMDDIARLIDDSDGYISDMEQQGYLSVYTYDEEPIVYFSSETLMDYLIARSMLKPLSELSIEERIEYIKHKTKALPSIKEALIITLFDKYKNKYQELKKIMVDTNLIDAFSPEVLIKIKFCKEDIQSFLNIFKTNDPSQWILYVGGYTDKPFNCTTYLNNYYINSAEAQLGLTNVFAERFYSSNVAGRLKNLLYFIAVNGADEEKSEEAGFFAMWCTASPNRTVRHLAMKLLYDVASRNDKFRHCLTEMVSAISDPYICEAIIYTLAYCDPGIKQDTRECFQRLIQDKSFCYARDLKRMAVYMGDQHMYITWDKNNLYKRVEPAIVSDAFQSVLCIVDLMDKYLLPFRYWGHDDFREFDLFTETPKQAITELNYDLNNNYKCIRNNYQCRNSDYFREYLFSLHNITGNDSLDKKSFALSYEEATRTIFKLFKENLEDDRKFGDDFMDSKFRKLIDISTNYFMGSIMCNYYKNDFHCYDGEDSWGFEVYDPLPYSDSEEINITPPIPVYNSKIEDIESAVISRIELPQYKNDIWHNDSALSEKNLIELIKPIEIKGEEWVLLAGHFSPEERDQGTIEWRDTYILYCCTSNNKSLSGRGDRYLTIEIPEYTGNIDYYSICSETSELCNNVRNITMTDEFDDTTLVLPPADLIRFFQLSPNHKDMSWIDNGGKTIIMCDNTKKSYFSDPANGVVLIRRTSLEEYLKKGSLKYFAFTERLIKDKRFSDESCFHYELQSNVITKKFKNNRRGDDVFEKTESDEGCIQCPYNLYEKRLEYRIEAEKCHDEFLELLKEYAPSDWGE